MISIIIINFNTPDLVEQAVSSVYQFIRDIPFEIIVIDNASSKGSIEKALINFPEVTLVKTKENIGFGRANNLGFEHAKGNFIFLLNSDAYLIDSTSVPLMITYLNQHDKVGIVGPNFIKADGSQNYAYGSLLEKRKIWSDIGFNKLSKEEWSRYATFKVCDVEGPQEVGYLAAAGIIIKKSVVDELGLFDPHIFLYYEDMELGWRYAQHDYGSVLLPGATIVHLGGGSGGSISKKLQEKIAASKKYYIKKRFGAFHFYRLQVASFFLLSLKRLKRRIS